MKRRLVTVMVFLVLGAIVNVALAWGCARWSDLDAIASTTQPGSDRGLERWRLQFDSERSSHAWLFSGTGCRRLEMWLNPPGGSLFRVEPGDLLNFAGDPNAPVDRIVAVKSGWPFLVLHGEQYSEGISPNRFILWNGEGWSKGAVPIDTASEERAFSLVPLLPIWPGFAINTVFYAGVLWLLFAAPLAMRQRSRIKRGLCPKCAYPVGESTVCTECGTAVSLSLGRERAGVREDAP